MKRLIKCYQVIRKESEGKIINEKQPAIPLSIALTCKMSGKGRTGVTESSSRYRHMKFRSVHETLSEQIRDYLHGEITPN